MLRSILVPLDGSPLAERALPIAMDIARRAGGTVHLIRAHVPLAIVGATAEGVFTQDMLAADDALRNRATQYLNQHAHTLAKEWGVVVEAHVEDGTPSACITEAADRVNAGLIVMTTHGAGGFAPGWLGSVCDAVIRHTHRAVLALPENDAHAGRSFVPKRIAMALDGSARATASFPPLATSPCSSARGGRRTHGRAVHPERRGEHPDQRASGSLRIDAEAAAAKEAIDTVVRGLKDVGLKAEARCAWNSRR